MRKPITEHWYARQRFGGRESVRIDVPMLTMVDLNNAAQKLGEVAAELASLSKARQLQMHRKILAARHTIAMTHPGLRHGADRENAK